jgi:adenylate cyclase
MVLWLPLATPMLVQLPLAMLIGLLGQYLFERRQKQRFSAAVSYYLPDSVALGLIGEGADLSAANQVLYSACLATDMAGFTTLGERMAPGELATFMNDYFEALAEPLKRHAVSVTEFRADAIMCAWTAEQADVAVRRQAAFAALDAVGAVAAFSERKQHPLACRVGLDVGHVYVGHAGGGGHFVYSIVGDCANTAARVEGLNQQLGTQVLATAAAIEGLDELLLRPLGRFVFVGKQAPLPVMELVAYRSDATHAQRESCDRFAAALDAFEARRWDQAQAQFEAFASIDKTDQISRIYLQLCREYRAVEPQIEDPCVIILDRK